jgi:hypothetical protein
MGTGTTATPPPGRARTRTVSVGDSLEEIVAHVPVDLVLAQAERADGLDELEHDFWNDPCHFLRRACQVADYEAANATPGRSESPRAPG